MRCELLPFPDPTERMEAALLDLALLSRGGESAAHVMATGEIVPRLWDITTICDPVLLEETWEWLRAFVYWLNSQHAWFSSDLTPSCWEQHPSLVHQLGSLAASRYFAGEATDAAAIEEWHRYALPTFLERTREQRHGCEERHMPWPARAAHQRAMSTAAGVRPPTSLVALPQAD